MGIKKRIRLMRPVARKNEDGSTSSHLMSWIGDPNKERGNFGVFPTIAPKKGKEYSSNPSDWESQTPSEAESKHEMIHVRSRRRAERLSAGSWKTGIEKREAMKEYRMNKKSAK